MTAALNNALVSQMESYITCSICLEPLQDPRTLLCFHSFCKCCLEKFVKGQREEAKGRVIEVFTCPECRTEFQIQQLEDMRQNRFIGNVIEALAIQRRPNHIQCNVCEHKVPAVSRCTECKEYLCRECLTAHEKWFSLKNHTVFTMEELVKPEKQDRTKEKSTCEKHKNEKLMYHCETCKKLNCIHCDLLEHNKRGHSCITTKQIAQKMRKLLRSSSRFLNDQLKEGSDALKHIEDVLQELKKNAEKAKDQLSQGKEHILKEFTKKQENALKAFTEEQKNAFETFTDMQKNDLTTLTKQLEIKAKLNKNELENTYNHTHLFLRNQKEDMNIYVERVKRSAQLSNHFLEKSTNREIVSLQKIIEGNVKKVQSERPDRMKPVHKGNLQYKGTRNMATMGELVPTPSTVVVATLRNTQGSQTFEGNGCPSGRPLNKMVASRDTSQTIAVCRQEFQVAMGRRTVAHFANPANTSSILYGHIEYVKQIEEWLGYHFHWSLCYRASSDGWTAQRFHELCDKKGATITIVKVGENIFGGYTNQNWQGQAWKTSNNSFLFSLRNKDSVPPFKAPIYRKHQFAICTHPNYGPTFGGGSDLFISNNSNNNQDSFTNFGHTYQPPEGYVFYTQQIISLLAGSFHFRPNDIEVFY